VLDDGAVISDAAGSLELLLKPAQGGYTNMGGAIVTGVAAPDNPGAATNKGYVDQSRVPPGGAVFEVLQKSSNADWALQWAKRPAGQLEVCFVADAMQNLTLTAMAAAQDYLANSIRHLAKVDLLIGNPGGAMGRYNEARLVVRKLSVAGAAGAILTLQGSQKDPGSAFVANDWLSFGCVVNLNAQNVTLDSGWVTFPGSLSAPNRYVCVTQEGGDGTTAPVIGSGRAYFR